ncbi:MAG: cohesin domain-containing protein [Bacteroidia bacterium]|nr:cohesin domain-containing protein [Bacteroidia bacterium]
MNNIGAFSLKLNYNTFNLTYLGFDNLNTGIDAESFIINSGNGTISMVFASPTPLNLDNITLVNLMFSNNGSTSSLTWDTQTLGNCEFVDNNSFIIYSVYSDGAVYSGGSVATITVQPTSKTVITGNNTNFTLSATGADSYQWQVSSDGGNTWNDLTNTFPYINVNYWTLSIYNIPIDMDQNQYRCIVSGPCPPQSISDTVVLTVNPVPPTVITTLGTLSSCPGEVIVPVNVSQFNDVASFSISFNFDTPVLTYIGIQDINPGLMPGTIVYNSVSNQVLFTWYSIEPITLGNAGLFNVKFNTTGGTSYLNWNVSSCEYSDLLGNPYVTIFNNGIINWEGTIPAITNQPIDKSIYSGQNTSFSVSTTGAISYQWQFSSDYGLTWNDLGNSAQYSGVNGSTLYINNATNLMTNYLFRVLVNGGCPPQLISQYALLTVTPQPQTISAMIGSVSNMCGGNLVIPVSVSSFTYVGSFSLTINYNTSQFTYSGYNNLNNLLLSGNYYINAINGQVKMTWVSMNPLSIGDGLLVELKFVATAGSSTLAWDTQTSGNCEFTDPDGNIIAGDFINGNIFVNSNPLIADTGQDTMFINGPVILNGTVTGGAAPYIFNWFPSDSLSDAAIANPIASPVSNIKYTFTVTDNNGCVTSDDIYIIVEGSDNPFIYSEPSSVSRCAGESLALTCLASGPSIIYNWYRNEVQIPDQSSGLLVLNPVNLSDSGYYYCVAHNSAGSDTSDIFHITVYSSPQVLSLGIDGYYCNNAGPDPLILDPPGGLLSGEGIVNGTFFPFILTPGNYTIKYSVTQNGCTTTIIENTTIIPVPFIDIQNSLVTDAICQGTSTGNIFATASGGAPPYNYIWWNGGTGQTVDNLSAGTYPVLVIDSNECTDTYNFIVQQPFVLTVNPAIMNNQCFDQQNGSVSLSLIGGTSPFLFQWSNGSTGMNQQNLAPGQYFVTITENNGCSMVHEFHVLPLSLLTVDESIIYPTCNGSDDGLIVLQVSGGGSPYQYQWSFWGSGYSNGIISGTDITGSATESLSILTPGSYGITVTDQFGCSVIADTLISAGLIPYSIPMADAGNDTTVCYGNQVILNASGGDTYFWSTGETTSQIIVTPAETTVYYVTVTNGGICSAMDSVTVKIIHANIISSDLSLCAGEPVTLSVDNQFFQGQSDPQASLLWSTSETTLSITVSPTVTTDCSVTVTDGNTSCNDEITITVNHYPVVDLGDDEVVCGSNPVLLDAGNPGAAYLWNNGSTGQTLVVTQSGLYSVTVSNGDCNASDMVNVTFYQPPVVDLGFDYVIYPGNSVVLNAGMENTSYLWSTGETSQSIVVSATGTYSVTLTNPCGSASDAVNVLVANPPVIEIFPSTIDTTINYGESVSKTFTISNSGQYNLSFNIQDVPWWLVLSQTTGIIAPGGFEEISLHFGNSLPGNNYSGLLHIYSNDPANPVIYLPVNLTVYQTSMYVSPTNVDFGNVVRNTTSTEYIYLVNNGNIDITINSISSLAPFVAGNFNSTLEGGQTMPVAIDFTPTATLFYNRLLSIGTSFGDFTVNLHGTGQNPAPGWSFSFTNYDFGYTDTATGGTAYLNIYNTGNVPAIITNATSTSSYFTIGENSFTIPVGGYHTVLLGFFPDALAVFSGILSFTSGNCGIQTVTVSGTGMMMTAPPLLTYDDSPPYNGINGVNPTVGPTSQYFEYSVIYTDPDNYPPIAGYPKLGIDRNGDGDFLDSEEGWITMSPESVEDVNYADGKKYVYLTNFPISSYLGYSFRAFNIYGNAATGEGTQYRSGPLVSNDLLDLLIYANDIDFSDATPNVGQEITIYATIHNNSDYPATVPFVVQFWKEDTLMGEQTVNYLAAQSAITLQMNQIFTYSEFYPIKVVVDAYNDLPEENKLNNFAIRPVIVGEFSIPGSISVTAAVVPGYVTVPWGSGSPWIHYYGHADYVGSFDPETNVSGATVTMTLIETGYAATSHTNSNGDFEFYLQSPVPTQGTAVYSLSAVVTDYTLTGISDTVNYTVFVPQKPDLDVYHFFDNIPNIFWTDTCINVGEPIDVSVYVWNAGNATAYNVEFYGYKDDPSDVAFIANYDSLSPGEARWEYFTVTFNTEGNHSVGIWADPDNMINEWNENNNQASVSRHIYNTDVDLIPANLSVSPSPPIEGQNVMMGLDVSNTLCYIAGSSVTKLFDILGTDTTLIAVLDYPQIGPMSSNTQWVNYSFVGSGLHTILAVVDYYNDVNESNENNNIGYWTIDIEPDLTFTTYPWNPLNWSLNVSATDVNVGDEINFTAGIKNWGNGDASNFYVRFKVDNVLLGAPIYIPYLAAQQSMTLVSDAWTIPDCGHTLEVVIDEENLVAESNENNNFAERDDIGLDLTPGSPYGSEWPNSPVIIGSTIWNYGSFEADSIAVYYYCTDCDPANNNLLLGFDVLPDVAADSPSYPGWAYSHIVYTFNSPGTYHIYAYVDTTTNCEINENNNVAWGNVNIMTEKPDLVVYSYHISPTELNPDPGESINIYSSFENISNVASGPFSVQFKVDSNPFGDVVVVPNLGPHQDTTVACTQPWSSILIGPHIIRVLLDIYNQVDESNEWNNEASRAIIVGDAPDMKFVESEGIILSDNYPQIFDNITIGAMIKNIGGAGGTANIKFYFVNGTDSTLIQTTQFTVGSHDSLLITIPWQAIASFGKIAAVISDCVPMEFNLLNNAAEKYYGQPNNPLSVETFASSMLICEGETVMLSGFAVGGTGSYQYSWSGPLLNLQNIQTIQVSPSSSSSYTLTVDDGLSTQTAGITISVIQPNASINGLLPGYYITDTLVLLTGDPAGGSFSGSGISGNIFNPQLAGPGSHLIQYNVTVGACPSEGTAMTTVYDYASQNVLLPNSWSIISTYINPSVQNIQAVFSSVTESLIIAKSGGGLVYWPSYGVNAIGNMQIGEGYQVKMSSARTLIVSGLPVIPELTPVNIPFGWSMIGYLRQSQASIVTMMYQVVTNIIIMKDGDGNVYWPPYGVNNIGNMKPGKGYQIKTTASCTLTYPLNTLSLEKSEVFIPETHFFGKPVNTGNNMTLEITNYDLPEAERITNCEIGVFDQSGLLVGSSDADGNFIVITIWGDDETTPEKDGLAVGEPFILKLWNPSTRKEIPIYVESWTEGDGLYRVNGIGVAGNIKLLGEENETIALFQNIPNPFKGTTTIEFYIPGRMKVNLQLLNVLGEKIQNLVKGEMETGSHKIEFISKDMLPGVYLYRLETTLGTEVRRMTILR